MPEKSLILLRFPVFVNSRKVKSVNAQKFEFGSPNEVVLKHSMNVLVDSSLEISWLETRKVLDSYRNLRCPSVNMSLFSGRNVCFFFMEEVSRFWNAGILRLFLKIIFSHLWNVWWVTNVTSFSDKLRNLMRIVCYWWDIPFWISKWKTICYSQRNF